MLILLTIAVLNFAGKRDNCNLGRADSELRLSSVMCQQLPTGSGSNKSLGKQKQWIKSKKMTVIGKEAVVIDFYHWSDSGRGTPSTPRPSEKSMHVSKRELSHESNQFQGFVKTFREEQKTEGSKSLSSFDWERHMNARIYFLWLTWPQNMISSPPEWSKEAEHERCKVKTSKSAMKATHEGYCCFERMLRKPTIERVADMAEAVEASSVVRARLGKATGMFLMAANKQWERKINQKRWMSETSESASKPGDWQCQIEQTIRQHVHDLMQPYKTVDMMSTMLEVHAARRETQSLSM